MAGKPKSVMGKKKDSEAIRMLMHTFTTYGTGQAAQTGLRAKVIRPSRVCLNLPAGHAALAFGQSDLQNSQRLLSTCLVYWECWGNLLYMDFFTGSSL